MYCVQKLRVVELKAWRLVKDQRENKIGVMNFLYKWIVVLWGYLLVTLQNFEFLIKSQQLYDGVNGLSENIYWKKYVNLQKRINQ